MSLKLSPIEPVPEETARIARAAFRKGNPLLKLRDELGAIFADADFADLFPRLGQPGLPPWRLALVTILQFREDLPDRRAAEAVRARIDWKHLLGLDLGSPGGFRNEAQRVKRSGFGRPCQARRAAPGAG
jgi:transposase